MHCEETFLDFQNISEHFTDNAILKSIFIQQPKPYQQNQDYQTKKNTILKIQKENCIQMKDLSKKMGIKCNLYVQISSI
ncbi:unnamed protein product [Paramecium sonneborni]|uniref:Uncharacterized protein n=1 Tax=Paramecium sonneborni TaxID=65129 RepID=A0A8S1M6G2_9CILI|nr:unnamed protein product [Paramecium sonneborni]